MYLFLADLILATHVLFAGFVVLGLAAILLGKFRHWNWIRNFRFRLAHLAAIIIVAAESWLGLACPLTEWENRLREVSGGNAYPTSFIQFWLRRVLFYDFDPWAFTATYTALGILMLIVWLLVPPERARKPETS